ncbi:sodium:alanine symporter family protein, partial [Enterobacter hormaechei]|nr:sodium:alanine symporter family protein [Enterobacter hormaechei]
MTDLINFINHILWDYALIYLLLGVGLYFTLRSGFIQLRHFGHMFSVLKNSNK